MSEKDINEEELVDLEEDCCDQDKLFGWKMKALYENEWFIGEIKCFIKMFAKYMVSFPDGLEDYINLEEISNIDIML